MPRKKSVIVSDSISSTDLSTGVCWKVPRPPKNYKGPLYVAIITHGNFCSFVRSTFLPQNSGMRILDASSYAFDLSWANILYTLCSGACLCIPSDVKDLGLAALTLQPTILTCPPSIARQLSPADFPTLQTLILAGEEMRHEDYHKWEEKVDVINGYGPCECTPYVSFTHLNNVQWIHLGRGPGATRWIVDLFNIDRLAPIGGVVQYNSDGTLRFVGRKATQTKLNGQRIEFGEVEHFIQQCLTGVVAEVAHLRMPKKQVLVAFMYETSHQKNADHCKTQLDSYKLQQAIDPKIYESLPKYMRPSLYIPLQGIPGLVFGKVDRSKLRLIAAEKILKNSKLLRQDESKSLRQETSEVVESAIHDKELNVKFGGELTKQKLIKRANRQSILVWTVHHALFDGWSMPLMLEQVTHAYHLEDLLPLQSMRPFITFLTNIGTKSSEKFWTNHLQDCLAPLFPSLSSKTYKPVATDQIEVTIPKYTWPRGVEATASLWLRAAWAIVLGDLDALSDVIFGNTVSGRNVPVQDIEHVVGPTIATIPVRAKWEQSQSFGEFVHALHKQSVMTTSFEHIGLQNLKRLNTDLERACSFQNRLTIQMTPAESHGRIWSRDSDSLNRGYDIYAWNLDIELHD
ncbi:MAG: hypothetical protein Q9167_007684 [Letrouitia subvulpina]